MLVYQRVDWLVVWNMNGWFFPSYWEFHHPNWRTHSIIFIHFSEGLNPTTNQVDVDWHTHRLIIDPCTWKYIKEIGILWPVTRHSARRCVTMRDDAWIFGGDSSNNGEIFVSTLLQDETTMEMAVPIIWTYLKDIVRGIFYLGRFPLSLKLMLCDSWVGGVSGYRLWRASQSMFQIAIGWVITQSLRVAWVYLEIVNTSKYVDMFNGKTMRTWWWHGHLGYSPIFQRTPNAYFQLWRSQTDSPREVEIGEICQVLLMKSKVLAFAQAT